METYASSLPAIDTIENGDNVNIAARNSTKSPSITVLDVPTTIKQETNGASSHVTRVDPLEMPPEDPGDIEGTDEEDILEIYTGRLQTPSLSDYCARMFLP